ncbi:YceD family protein [Breoghania sp.]|uniref:YceD family protein n=1 Tax=Breoghania sp. TaxID=2065378 RepID=UPI00262BA237|nr:YceD family protein [Breoghania sp.]MDJ0932296.1 YceD family protein [Breoghania sp.]
MTIALSSTRARNVHAGRAVPDAEMAALADYVRATVADLAGQGAADIVAGCFTWPDTAVGQERRMKERRTMADRDRLEVEGAAAHALGWRQPIDAVPPAGVDFDRTADEAERARLCEVCDLLEVLRMEAHFTIKPWRKTGFSVKGRVSAEVVQACVVSLEPVKQTVDEEVDVKFAPAREADKWREMLDEDGEIIVDPEAEDPPDLFKGNAIEVGALAAEYFALGLDPYPRASGVAFEGGEVEETVEEDREIPFAGLKAMMEAKKEDGN